MKQQKFMARQGDVLIRQIDQIPSEANEINEKVIAVGEGHHEHTVIGEIDVFENEKSLYLKVNSNGQLAHVKTGTTIQADHLPIPLPTGNYEVIHQREYNAYEASIHEILD